MSREGYWFISYCSKDLQIVEQIVSILERCGIFYWKAPEMIPAGSNYAREIPKALKNCSVVLFIISQASQSSIWVEKEIDIAVNSRKKIIPVKIDDTPLNDMYCFYLNNVQMIDIRVQSNGQMSNDAKEILYSRFMGDTVNNDGQNKKHPVMESRAYKIDTRTNAFRINKIPMQCNQCGAALDHVDVGTYKCPGCNIEYYDDFQKIRNFLRDNGPAPAFVIARNAGVSKQAVEYYFSDNPNTHYSGMDYSRARLTRQPGTSRGEWHSNSWKR